MLLLAGNSAYKPNVEDLDIDALLEISMRKCEAERNADVSRLLLVWHIPRNILFFTAECSPGLRMSPNAQDLSADTETPEAEMKGFMASLIVSFVGYIGVHMAIRASNLDLYITALQMTASLKSQSNNQNYSRAMAEMVASINTMDHDSESFKNLEKCWFSVSHFLMSGPVLFSQDNARIVWSASLSGVRGTNLASDEVLETCIGWIKGLGSRWRSGLG